MIIIVLLWTVHVSNNLLLVNSRNVHLFLNFEITQRNLMMATVGTHGFPYLRKCNPFWGIFQDHRIEALQLGSSQKWSEDSLVEGTGLWENDRDWKENACFRGESPTRDETSKHCSILTELLTARTQPYTFWWNTAREVTWEHWLLGTEKTGD